MADPRYLEIARDLEQRIVSGEWAPGQQLPSEADLGERYAKVRPQADGVDESKPASRNTIRQALRILTSRGLVSAKQGQGTFVAEKYVRFVTTLSRDPETGFGGGEGQAYQNEVEGQGRTPFVSPPRVETQEATSLVASALKIEPGDYVISRHQRRFIDDKPYSLQTSFYKMSFVEQGASKLIAPRDIEEGVVTYLKKTLNIEQVGYQDTITVRPPNSIEMDFFGLPLDGSVAVYETYRTAYDSSGNPFRVTISVFPADRNIFIINVDEVPSDVIGNPWIPPE